MRGSNIAREIAKEYKHKLNEYIVSHCRKCANKDTQLCHIVTMIDGRLNCAEYEEKKGSK